MKTYTETITPEMARTYLEKNTSNRRMRANHVAMLANEIKIGNWRLTHQGIAFLQDGTLVDGQHRLAAIIAADKPVQMSVTYGVSTDCATTIDGGAKRGAQDVAAFVGQGWVTLQHVAIARALMLASGTMTSRSVSNSIVVGFCQKHSADLVWAASSTSPKHCGASNIARWAATGATYICAKAEGMSIASVDRFAEVLRSGEMANHGEAVIVRLRNWAADKSPTNSKAASFIKVIMRCMKAFRDGENLMLVKEQSDFAFKKWIESNK